MVIILKTRIPCTPENPYRKHRPSTSKIIFLSTEGRVTEEEYFILVPGFFEGIETKIQFISVQEDAIHTNDEDLTPEQKSMLGKSKPKQLVEKIDQFKMEQAEKYQFDQYEDEFWIVTDIDDNLNEDKIEKFHEALDDCDHKGYGYAISNPFFELWLLLHHDDVTSEDSAFAVTDVHNYKKTAHFRKRLRDLKAPLIGKNKKQIKEEDYTRDKVLLAAQRAKDLYIEDGERYPKYLATTVFRLIDKMLELL